MVNLIVAISKNNVIGKGNQLPWHYKEDLAYFKKTTMNQTVIMGEATFKSILSHIDKEYEGDVFFKDIDYSNYNKIKEYISGELNFSVYERK